MLCAVCGYELDCCLECFDLWNFTVILDYWCPQCHSTETTYLHADGTVSTNYIKG